jgi:alpha-tubulin suppressor-like RCC1 family protein
VVTGVKPGTTTVLAQSGAQIATVTVNVTSAFNLRDQTLTMGGDSWSGYFTCALAEDRTAYCWGRNRNGQLGDGTTTTRTEPTPVAGGIRFSSISAGRSWTCGIDVQQDAYCWGGGYNGVLGDGSNYNSRSLPGLVSGGKKWRSVSASSNHVCGIATDGRGYCWGTNYQGQLGNGRTGNNQGGTTADALTPEAIQLDQSLREIVAHQSGSCAITTAGDAYCWGWNGSGELGNGQSGGSGSPTPVKVLGGYNFEAITAGNQTVCGQVATGTIYCWGASGGGKLPFYNNSSIPQPVLFGGTDIRSLSLGSAWNHACGLAANAKVYCWGSNDWGKLGTTAAPSSNTLVEVSLGGPAVTVVAGEDHNCAVLQSGALKCWGSNIDGELGNGTSSFRQAPTGIQGDKQFTSIDLGDNSSCALDSTGKAWCWGGPGWTFRNGPENAVLEPVAVSGALSFVELANFSQSKCGRQSNGQVWCWGAGWNGQRGDGTQNSGSNPTRVSLTDAATQLAGGYSSDHMCALTAAGSLFCWGSNWDGQIGDNSTVFRTAPVKVSGTYSAASVGASHTCALTADGTAWCWGSNQQGQLGTGAQNSNSLTPVRVLTNLKFSQVVAGMNFTCGIAASPAGKLYCWGDNNFNKLATGVNGGAILTPFAVISSLTFDKIAPGGQVLCARSSAGEWYCAGENEEWSVLGTSAPPRGTTREVGTLTKIGGDPGLNELSLGFSHACGIRTASKQTYCWGESDWGKITGTINLPGSVSGSTVFRGSR